MPWSIAVHQDPVMVETTYAGRIEPEELARAAKTTLARASDVETNLFLADCSALEGGHSVVDLYWLADWLEAQPRGHAIREAVILPGLEKASEVVTFWQTTCSNRGLKVRVFDRRQAGIAWLREQASP